MITWDDLKSQVSVQMQRDPQNATLNWRAIQGVEEGLRRLTAVGFPFELVGKGERPAPQAPRPNPIADKFEEIAGAGSLGSKEN